MGNNIKSYYRASDTEHYTVVYATDLTEALTIAEQVIAEQYTHRRGRRKKIKVAEASKEEVFQYRFFGGGVMELLRKSRKSTLELHLPPISVKGYPSQQDEDVTRVRRILGA